ncbi:NnrU family protein [Agrobacterium pusense]|uniref:NnrU family protein n=1 Tax=Agrobacterium pusense TaxID=648995 RepID=UPI003D10CE3B
MPGTSEKGHFSDGWVGFGLGPGLRLCGHAFPLSHPLHQPLVARMGEKSVSSLYSLVAAVTLAATIWSIGARLLRRRCGASASGLCALATEAMLIASILLMGSLIRNAALPGAADKPQGLRCGTFTG